MKNLATIWIVALLMIVGGAICVPVTIPAEAHDGTRWGCLAHWEGAPPHNWQTNTGNGYYGGLQQGMPFWNAYGGRRYAARADLATRWEQIQIGRNGAFRGDWKYQRTNGRDGDGPQGGSSAWPNTWGRCTR